MGARDEIYQVRRDYIAMRNLIWIIIAAVIAFGGYMLYSGRSVKEIAETASDAVNAPEALESATAAVGDAVEATEGVVAEAVEATAQAADAAANAVSEAASDAADAAVQATEEAAAAAPEVADDAMNMVSDAARGAFSRKLNAVTSPSQPW